jgi:autotransporter-associated beta strand protein
VYDAAGRILPAGIGASAENTWTAADNSYTLSSGGATLTGTRTLNSLRYTGGTNTLALGANNLETFGILNGGFGVMTISSTSGVIRQPGTSPANLYLIAGNNSIRLSAPIQDHGGALTLVKSGGSTLALSGTNSFSGGVVLNAGTLELNSNTALGAGPLKIFGGALTSLANFANANANTVEINGDFAFGGSTPMNLGMGAVSLGTLPGTTRTISGSGSGALTLGGVISNGTTANALTKAGSNTLVLSGANNYSGGTTVSGGTLTARNGSALGTGDVTVTANGNLSYAATADESLTIGRVLNIIGGAVSWVIGADATSAKIAVAGAATATGAVQLNMSLASGASLPGGTNIYTLIQGGVGSSLNGATYTLKVLNNTDYTIGTPTITATDLTVSVTGGVTPLTTAYWKGGLTGATSVWAASNGSTQSNWVANSGGASQPLVPSVGTSIIFSNSAVTTSPTSSTLGADMTIQSLTQQDTVNSVSLNADGFSLTITPNNPTTGITVVSGARPLTINSSIVLGAPQTWTNDSTSGLLSVAGNVTSGTNQLTINGTRDTTISGVIAGAAGLSMAGSGTLTLSGANAYTGATVVTAGTLAEGTTGSIADTSDLTVNGATAVFSLGSNHSDIVGTVTLQGGGNITGGFLSTLTASTGHTFEMQAGTVSAILAGAGIALNKTTAGTVTLSGANTFTGPTTVTEGTLAEGSAGSIANTSNLTVNGPTAIFSLGPDHSDIVGTVTLQGGGSITGSGTSAIGVSAGRTLEMQSGSVSAILAGTGVPLNKTTDGTVTLSGMNTYTGPTIVTAGTLLVNGSISASVATVSNADSKLGGSGAVGNVTVGSGAILQGGLDSAASGTLTSGGVITLTDGSVIRLALGANGTHSSLTRTGSIWVFDNDQSFDFTILSGASSTTYNDVISGLTGSETGLDSIGTWLITTAGVTGTFNYDGTGGVDLTLSVIPEPGTLALLLAGLPLLRLRCRPK